MGPAKSGAVQPSNALWEITSLQMTPFSPNERAIFPLVSYGKRNKDALQQNELNPYKALQTLSKVPSRQFPGVAMNHKVCCGNLDMFLVTLVNQR